MKMLMKILMSCLVTCIVVQPLYAYADTVYTEGYLKYVLEDEAISICGYFGSETEVTLPSSIAGYPVSKIAKGAFSESKTVKKIILPDTIMTIEEGAVGQTMTVVYDGNIERVPENPTNTDMKENPNMGTTAELTEKPDTNIKPDVTTDNSVKNEEVIGEELVADIDEDTTGTTDNSDITDTQDKDDIILETETIYAKTVGNSSEELSTKNFGIGKILAIVAIPVIIIGAGVGIFFLKKNK